MDRFRKDLDLVLTVMSEEKKALEAILEPAATKKAKETFNYPDWVDYNKPDMPKAWRARPSWMRGVEVSDKKAREWKDESVIWGGKASSTEQVVTLKDGRQLSGKVAAEDGAYVVKTEDGDIKVPKGKVFSIEAKKIYDHLTGKNRATLSTVVLPLEHGWTEKEILYAMWDMIVDMAAWYTKYKGKWEKGLKFEDAIQEAGIALLDAIRTDVGGSPFTAHAATHMNKYLARRAKKERAIQKKEGVSYDQPVAGEEGERNPMLDLLAGTDSQVRMQEAMQRGDWDWVWNLFKKANLSNAERDVAVRLLGIGMDSGERWTPPDSVVLKDGSVLEGRFLRVGGAMKTAITLLMPDGSKKTIAQKDIKEINPNLPAKALPLLKVVLKAGVVIGRQKDSFYRPVGKPDAPKDTCECGASLKKDATQCKECGKMVDELVQYVTLRTESGEEVEFSLDDIQKDPTTGRPMTTEIEGEVKGQWHNPDVYRRAVGYPSEPRPMGDVEIAKELNIDVSTVKSYKKSVKKKFEAAGKGLGMKPGEAVVGTVKAHEPEPSESVAAKPTLNEWKRQMGLRIL